jgi:hypothetical protein
MLRPSIRLQSLSIGRQALEEDVWADRTNSNSRSLWLPQLGSSLPGIRIRQHACLFQAPLISAHCTKVHSPPHPTTPL